MLNNGVPFTLHLPKWPSISKKIKPIVVSRSNINSVLNTDKIVSFTALNLFFIAGINRQTGKLYIFSGEISCQNPLGLCLGPPYPKLRFMVGETKTK